MLVGFNRLSLCAHLDLSTPLRPSDISFVYYHSMIISACIYEVDGANFTGKLPHWTPLAACMRAAPQDIARLESRVPFPS